MPRLAPLLADAAGELRVELRTERDSEGAGWLRGELRGLLSLNCQRGLHAFEWRCELPVNLRLVFSEAEADRLLKEADPYVVLHDRLPLREMVEDEVLLALPMMPRCGDPNCLERLQ